MTETELAQFLNGTPLFQLIDVKTLILEDLRKQDTDKLEQWFMDRLPDLDEESLTRYLYMKRS
jgi:hypothetical protein